MLFGPASAPQHTGVAPLRPGFLLTPLGINSSGVLSGTTSSMTGTQWAGDVRGTIQVKNVRLQGWFQNDTIGREGAFREHEPWVRLSAIE